MGARQGDHVGMGHKTRAQVRAGHKRTVLQGFQPLALIRPARAQDHAATAPARAIQPPPSTRLLSAA